MSKEANDVIIFNVLKENLTKLLAEEQFNKEQLKKIKNTIQIKLHNEHYSIKTSELAEYLIKYLINIKRINNEEDFNQFIKKSFFLKNELVIKDFSRYSSQINHPKVNPDVLEKLDLKSIDESHQQLKQESFFQEIVDKEVDTKTRIIKQEAKAKIDKEMDKLAIEKKKIESLKSCIDEYIFKSNKEILDEIEDINVKYQYLEENRLWYKDLELISDPFPSENGLEKINQELYEKIVIQTEIFRKYVKYLNSDPDLLLGQTIVYGEYGCGKTTFFDYISYRCLQKNILPIRIIYTAAESSLQKLWEQFRSKIFDEVSCFIETILPFNPRHLYQTRNDSDICDLFGMIVKGTAFKSFLIFLDGLHKSQDSSEIPIKFLIELQNFLEYFKRKGYPLGIFIAGANEWIKDVNYDGKLSGSIYQSEEIGSISPREAFDMLKNRFQAFSKKPSENFAYFSNDDILKLINTIKKTGTPKITFRLLIKAFKRRGFASEKGIKFDLKLERDILQTIVDILKENEFIFKKFQKLYSLCDNNRDRFVKIQHVISAVYEKQIVMETTPFFTAHKSIFGLLMKNGIIKKGRNDDTILFSLDKNIQNIFLKIEKRVKFSPKYYLDSIFCEQKIGEDVEEEGREKILEFLDRIIRTNPNYGDDLRIIKRTTEENYLPLTRNIEKSPDFTITKQDIDKMDETLEVIIRFIHKISGEVEIVLDRDQLFTIFKYSWLDNEALSNYFTATEKYRSKIHLSKYEGQTYLKIYTEAYEALISKVLRHINLNQVIIVGSKDLSNYDKYILNNARGSFEEGKYTQCIKSYTDLIENHLRDWIYNILELKYGKDWFQNLPEFTKSIINMKRSGEKTKYGKPLENQNFLYFLGRSDYLPIIINKDLWKECFSQLVGTENIEVIQKLKSISLLANLEKHNRTDEQLKELYIQIKEELNISKVILKMINHSYINLLDTEQIIIQDKNIFIGCKKPEDISKTTPIQIESKDIDAIERILKEFLLKENKFRDIYINLDDRASIQTKFSIYYITFIGALTNFLKTGKIRIKDYEGSQLLFEMV